MPKGIYLKQISIALFWSGMYVAARIISAEVPAFSASFIRFFLAACILLIVWAVSPKTSLPRGKEWVALCFLGLTGVFIYNFLFFSGMASVPAGRGAVIITTNPIFTAFFAWLIFKEKLSLRKIIGISLAGFGAMLVVTHGQFSTLFSTALSRGDLLLFGAALSWSAYSLCNKLVRNVSAVTAITFTCVIGCVLLFPFACVEGLFSHLTSYSWQAWLALVYVVICCTVLSFVWFNQGVVVLGAQRASLFINLIPAFSVLLGVLVLNETLALSAVLGVFIVCAGVLMANR